jgi:nucleoside-diphosphate-sugar epimerase
MKVFITGATGWIGSAVAAELLEAGHEVVGLARSDANVEKLEAAGVRPRRGDLTDLDSLRAGAEDADAVVQFGNLHDFSDQAKSGRVERDAVETFGELLAGSDRALVIASGMMNPGSDEILTEATPSRFVGPDSPRGGAEALVMEYADRGVRSIVARFAPTVHGHGDYGFMAGFVRAAREHGVSGYIGDGSNRWAAVHRLDAAHLVCLALDDATPGTVVHAVAEQVPTREIAEAIGEVLGVPTDSVDPADAGDRFGFLSRFFGLDMIASSAVTRERFGWAPTHPTLLEDLRAGAYTA